MRNRRVGILATKSVLIFIGFLFISLSGLLFSGDQPGKRNSEKNLKSYQIVPTTEVKNVIFLIGDGMGISQIAATRIKLLGADGRLNIEKMPVTGLINTHPAIWLTTDSAAAGTALSTGFKTNNGMIAINPRGEKLLTILEASKKQGKSTGLVVTSRITHATPASFAAHVRDRDNEAEIAVQLLKTGADVMLGGGKDYFIPKSEKGSKRPDNNNLLHEAQNNGYRLLETAADLQAVKEVPVLGLFHLKGLTTQKPEPSLAAMTAKAIQLLCANSQGFFLMVEGSQIDWAGHDNDIKEVIRQMKLFDDAVAVCLEFALKDQKTLVIVTGDHETGGLAIQMGTVNGKLMLVKWTTDGHTGQPLPLFAFGPGALSFSGLYDNTQVPRKLAKLLKIKDFPKIFKK